MLCWLYGSVRFISLVTAFQESELDMTALSRYLIKSLPTALVIDIRNCKVLFGFLIKNNKEVELTSQEVACSKEIGSSDGRIDRRIERGEKKARNFLGVSK